MAVTASNAFILMIVVLHARVIATEALKANLVYVSSRSDGCEGPLPIVQLSARFREHDTNQPFGGWNLIAHYTGNCSSDQSVLLNNSGTFTQYQFRVELSQAASCQCITLASISHSLSIVQEEWNKGTFWCGDEQPSGPLLCASEDSSRFFISRVVQTKNLLPTTLPCGETKFSTLNTQNLAVAYSKTYFGTCPSRDTCFPWKVVKNIEEFEDASVSLNFTLTFNKDQQAVSADSCSNVSYANDGVLLESTPPGFAKALKFFYSSHNTHTRLPLVEFLTDKRVKLTYGSNNITVSGRFIDSEVLNVSIISSELANNRIGLQWKQIIEKSSLHCKKWSLSNVKITLHYNEQYDRCTRNIFENNLNFEPAVWSVFNSTRSCNQTSCLNFSSTADQQNVVRTSSTDPLDLSVVTGRLPPPAPTFVPAHKMTCSNGLTLLEVKFELTVRSFRYPTPCRDLLPHGINMTVSSVPLAYFAPIVNTRWPGFNATTMSFMNSDGSQCPVYHPRQNSVTVISACVNTTEKQFLSIAWVQENFMITSPLDDHWYMYIEQVKLGGSIVSNISRTEKSQVYTLDIVRDRQDLPAPSCFPFPKNESLILLTHPFSNAHRIVNLTLNLTSLPPPPPTEPTAPVQLTCSSEGSWSAAVACSIVTSTSDSCSLHSTATRICYCNGTWADEMCRTVYEQDLDLIDESPKAGLVRMMTLSITHINSSQWFHAFQRAIDIQFNRTIDVEFVEIAVEFIDRLLNNSVEVPGVQLLILLDTLAQSINSNTTIFFKNIGLRVKEVYPNRGDITAIQYEENYITLPQEIFRKPAFVGSLYFRNISHLIPGERPASPVISSVVRCSECVTSDLMERVKIQLLVDDPTNDSSCVFANLKLGVSGDDFWNRSGCRRVQFGNGTVLCECDHLTHFAILLSPGVEVPQNHLIMLTTIGQVLGSVSLVFLLITIIVFIVFRSLWSMRIYIHIMLCASLFIAQLLFIAGVGQTENETACSVIAVVLHYSFLVVFMWMLMEGIVLYVMLVRVFIKHHARYLAAFTIASFGIPLVYIIVVAPIGFLVNTDNNGHHYNQYNSQNERIACWLRYDTHFIFAFIAPVVLIILVNCGFLVMALVITYRHYKKQAMKRKINEAKHWIKVVFSLMLVLGIVWIGNLLFFNTTLLAVAYIMVIFIAAQGFFVFVLFVPMSKQVRDTYMKWWRIKKTQSSFLSKVFPSKSLSSLPAPTTTKKLYRSKTALANYYDHKNHFNENHVENLCDVHLYLDDDDVDCKKPVDEKIELADKKWDVSKRKVLRRATVTNVHGEHVMEIYKNCGTTESISDVSKSEDEL